MGSAADDRVWIGDGGTGLIDVYDDAGSKLIEFELPIPARPFDEVALERAREAALARVEDQDRTGWRASIEGLYSAALRPATVPAGLGLSAVGRDRFAVVRRDADGAERIQIHRLGR